MIWPQGTNEFRAWLQPLLWRVPAALAILALGGLSVAAVNLVGSRLQRDPEFTRRRTMYPAIISIVILLATAALMLLALGVPGSVIGFVVTTALALGLVSDSLGGIRIFLLQPFRVGDLIEIQGEEITGVVEQITLDGTILRTEDWNRVLIPNRLLFEHPIVNHSADGAGKILTFEFVVESPKGIDTLENTLSPLIAASESKDLRSLQQILISKVEAEKLTVKVQFASPPYSSGRVASAFIKAAEVHLRENAFIIHSLSVLKS